MVKTLMCNVRKSQCFNMLVMLVRSSRSPRNWPWAGCESHADENSGDDHAGVGPLLFRCSVSGARTKRHVRIRPLRRTPWPFGIRCGRSSSALRPRCSVPRKAAVAGAIGFLALTGLMLQGCAGTPSASTTAGASSVEQASGIERPAEPEFLETDYHIGASDLLEIEVLGVEELKRTVRVNSTGSISMPLIGMVEVAGLTSRQIEDLLVEKYEKDYLQDPQISVFIKEFTSQRFTVDGAVLRPGIYPLTGKMTLLRALATAGGKGDLADLENVMLFRVNEGGETETLKYDVLKIRAGDELDPALQRDDVVVVNRNKSRVSLRDSLFRDVIDTLNPFSSTYYNVDGGRR